MSSLHCESLAAASRSLALPLLVLLTLNCAQGQEANDSPKKHPASNRNGEMSGRLLSTDLRAQYPPPLPANVVVEKMMATSARRSAELQGFSATRTYDLQYHGFLGTREAGMKVISTYTAPDRLQFSVVSENGSRLLLNRVLLRLLDSERQAMHDQSKVELNPENYLFASEGSATDLDDPCYVLAVKPRHENQFLYRGKVWIDAHDFALAHMEGQPAKSPSFWIKDTQIDSTWRNVQGFWLIQHSRSVSHIRMGGAATLTIDYSDYQVSRVGGMHGRAQNPQLPDPSSVTPQH